MADGVNLVPYVTGKDKGIPHRTIYLRKYDDKKFAVRHDNYKLVTRNRGRVRELYDLTRDIGETNNVAGRFPERLEALDEIRAEWNSQLMDPAFLGLIHTDAWKNRKKK